MNQPGGEKQILLRGKKKSPKDRGSRSADMVKSLAEKYKGKFNGKGLEAEKYGPPRARTQRERKPDEDYEKWYFEEREKKSWHDHEHDETMGFGQQKRGFKVKNIPHPRGKNPGDLWRIPTTPFPGAHFSTFPPKLIEPIVKAGCPRWVCSRCGKPRIRITEKTGEFQRRWSTKNKEGSPYNKQDSYQNIYETTGWSDCGCEADWTGGVVLDPFAGSGTALRVARRLGRRFIGIEINPEYAEMCERRLKSDTYQPPPEGVQPLTEIFDNE